MESAHNIAENDIQSALACSELCPTQRQRRCEHFGARPAYAGSMLGVAATAGYTIAPFAHLCISDFVRWRENRLLSNY